MKLFIPIKDKEKRIQLAAELNNIIKGKTYIPSLKHGKVYKSDIGIQGKISDEDLVQIEGLIERRGLTIIKNGVSV